jgi:hypothetical protein
MAAGLPSDEAPLCACHREASYSGGADMHKAFDRKKQLPLIIKLFISVVFISFILLTSCTLDPNGYMNMYFTDGDGAQVTLEWNTNNESDLAGYKIYYGLNSHIYTNVVDVGNTNSYTLTGLTYGETYYISTTAYSIVGYESAFSEEIVYNTTSTGNTY